MPRACAIGARRTWRSAPTLAYTSPQSNTRTHTFASTNRGWEIFRPNLANSATTTLPFRVVVDDRLHVSSTASIKFLTTPIPVPEVDRSIDRASMDTDTTSTDSQFHPAPAFSAAGARAVVCSLAARGAESLARGLVTCVFATVGTVLGAITGGLIGLATETGVLRGTGVGGITGALVSMEVVDSSLALWRSDEPAIWSVVYVLDVIWSLLSGRLVREKVDPAVLNAVESQMSAAEAPVLHGDHADIFGTGGTNGMARVAIDALPVVRFTERSNVDASGELIACSVCLQEFEAGESARSLPVCRHTFHLPCIDGWLLRHASCPLCRRAV